MKYPTPTMMMNPMTVKRLMCILLGAEVNAEVREHTTPEGARAVVDEDRMGRDNPHIGVLRMWDESMC